MLAVITAVCSWAGPASACSIGVPPVQYLDELDPTEVVAIVRPEVVARTGAARGWHRAGVIGFTSAWLVGGDAEAVAETVWTTNSGRREKADDFCGFLYEAQPVGTREEFHVLMDDGYILPLASGLDPGTRALDPVPVDPAVLTDRYGPPVEITPDPDLVWAAYAPLAAERRANDLSIQLAILVGIVAMLRLALLVARGLRSSLGRAA